MAVESSEVLARLKTDRERHLEELKDFLRIPSISTDPDYRDDVLRCGEFVRQNLEDAGLKAELVQSAGYPLVYAEWLGAPGRPTLLFYGHYDVQPPDPLELWRNPPFEPTVEDGRVVARGATDDKGQVFAQMKAVEAYLSTEGKLPVNVKFLIEGEEESGGESIEQYVIEDGGKRLACDAVVVSDSSMYAKGQPSLLYGLKGLAYMELKVKGPSRDLHSGTYGGAVANPANALCQIVAKLRDPDSGRILIPGFYDDVLPIEDWERKEFAQLPFDEKEYCEEIGVKETFGEEGYTTLERAWARPTCDVNGLFGGYEGKGAKTVLPAWSGAKVSMRLVPNQDPHEIARLFEAYVHSVTPRGVTTEIRFLHGAPAVEINAEGPMLEAAKKAQEETWGKAPVLIREGGSIPIVGTFSDVLHCPVLLVGLGLPDDRLHSPNEKIDLENYYRGIETIARLLKEAGDVNGA